MARRVLISFLGTNTYEKCRYIFPNGHQSDVVRFVQEAICANICQNWDETDGVYIFLTDGERGSKVTNWEGDNYQQPGSTDKDGLQTKLQQLGLKCQIIPQIIPEGFTDKDNQSIFDAVFAVLKDGDHIYLDITNAFRSISLFGAVLVNYAQFLLSNVNIEAVMYGAFEALGPVYQVKKDKPDPSDRHAPILYLTEMLRLQEWTIAANDFIYHGNAKQLAALSRQNGFETLSDILNKIGGSFSTVRGKSIIEAKIFNDLKVELKNIENKQQNPAMKRILEKIEAELSKFTSNNINNGINAVEWCLQHKLIQQGITLLQETIITYLCSEFTYRDDIYEGHRQMIAHAMNCKPISPEKWKLSPHIKKAIKQIHENDKFKKLEPAYNMLKKYRNDINHGGFEKKAEQYENFEQKLRDSLEIVRQQIRV